MPSSAEGRRSPKHVVAHRQRGVHQQVVQRRPVPVVDRGVQHAANGVQRGHLQRHRLVVLERPEHQTEPEDARAVAKRGDAGQHLGPVSGQEPAHDGGLSRRRHPVRFTLGGDRDCRHIQHDARGRAPRQHRHPRAQRGADDRAALRRHRRGGGRRRPGRRDDLRRRRLDRRHVRHPVPAARPRRPRPGRLLQAQLRPAPRDARRHRPGPRRDRRHDGRRPPEPAVRPAQAGRGDRRRRRRRQRPPARAARRVLPAPAALADDQRDAGAAHPRRHLRLRLLLQRLPARRDRAGAATGSAARSSPRRWSARPARASSRSSSSTRPAPTPAATASPA